MSASQETGRKTLDQLVRRWVEERGSAHDSPSVGMAWLRFDRRRRASDAEISFPHHFVIARVAAPYETVALALLPTSFLHHRAE
jgi:hypothetical protein